MGDRKPRVEKTRARIIDAARKLIVSRSGLADFSIDAVARRAGVARMTVYYQFKSRVGLLEALFDDIAARGEVKRAKDAFANPEPTAALAQYIAVLGRFWTLERVVIRRLSAMATLDSDFEKGMRRRDAHRRDGIRVLMQRLAEASGRPEPEVIDDTVGIVAALTNFSTFDHLAGVSQTPQDVVPIITRLVFLALGLEGKRTDCRIESVAFERDQGGRKPGCSEFHDDPGG